MTSSGAIGVVCRDGERPWVEEFFEFFKTPWEFYRNGRAYSVVISTGERPENLECRLLVIYSSAASDRAHLRISEGDSVLAEYEGVKLPLYGKVTAFCSADVTLARLSGGSVAVAILESSSPFTVIRAGYDLFRELAYLLSAGQPVHNASSPTLEIHISMLRHWILSAGIPLVEIPPSPAGFEFTACLTHDVDFIRITDHKLDHTLLGFIRRASIGSLYKVANQEMPWSRLLQNMSALASLPAVYLGLRQDFWFQDFDRYLELERDTKATFFFIPFKNRAGENVQHRHRGRRAAAYDVINERRLVERLAREGNEISVHGIDAWRCAKKGREERDRIAEVSGNRSPGVRMHWLCFDAASPRVLEEAGFPYDSTIGYNDAVGYRAGALQPFRPEGAARLLELPLHIQDSALFYPGRLGLNEGRAWKVCESVVRNAQTYGGVLTILWHTRSMAPERHWGDFYIRLLESLKSRRVWFATAAQAVEWFQSRRSVSFQSVDFSAGRLRVALDGRPCVNKGPSLAFRVHLPNRGFKDIPWRGDAVMDLTVS